MCLHTLYQVCVYNTTQQHFFPKKNIICIHQQNKSLHDIVDFEDLFGGNLRY